MDNHDAKRLRHTVEQDMVEHGSLEIIQFPFLILSLLPSYFYVFAKLVRSYNTFSSNNQPNIRENKSVLLRNLTDHDFHHIRRS